MLMVKLRFMVSPYQLGLAEWIDIEFQTCDKPLLGIFASQRTCSSWNVLISYLENKSIVVKPTLDTT